MNRKRVLAVGLLAALLTAGGATGSQATVPGKNGLIVFERLVGKPSRTCNPCTDLFTIRAGGSGLRRITSVKSASHAAWAPDGKRVVMEHEGTAIVDIRSGRIQRLKAGGIFPAVSPDGKWILYGQSTHEHNEGIWIMRANGRQPRYVPNADGCTSVSFSPAGGQFACIRKSALFVVNVDGSGRTPLVRPKFGAAGHIDWSPDGSRILFHSNYRVFTIRPDGTELTRVTREGSFCPGSFSPDGSKILALGNCVSETSTYLVTMNVDGTGVSRIPNTEGGHWASWGRQP